jgi:predicted small secreted protein
MTKKAIALAIVAAAIVALGGCMNTMKGVGNDVQQNTNKVVKATTHHR